VNAELWDPRRWQTASSIDNTENPEHRTGGPWHRQEPNTHSGLPSWFLSDTQSHTIKFRPSHSTNIIATWPTPVGDLSDTESWTDSDLFSDFVTTSGDSFDLEDSGEMGSAESYEPEVPYELEESYQDHNRMYHRR